jgi:hypothetical protein
MKVLQSILSPQLTWIDLSGELSAELADLVFVFGLRVPLADPPVLASVRSRFPRARLILASTSGHIADTEISDQPLVCTALSFDSATVRAVMGLGNSPDNLAAVCHSLASDLRTPGLRHVLLFSDGNLINGTILADAFASTLPPSVSLSGGLAGDGTDFALTLVGLDAAPVVGGIVAVGLYGDSLDIRCGNAGGWSVFGPARTITRAKGNILHTLDDRPALALYRSYLGPEAAALPAAALRFPLRVISPGGADSVVRSILSIDESAQTMTFAGDLPVGASAQLMRASYEELVTGAEDAARQAFSADADFVLCVSCVGRRVVLGQNTENELEVIRATLGSRPVIAGFYAYGELTPSGTGGACRLQNQSMSITSFAERAP